MDTKTGRNDLCHCGSGKKYKNCCWKHDNVRVLDGDQALFQKIANGEIPYKAEISSSSDNPLSMQISNVRVVKDGIEHILLDDEIELSINTVDGKKMNNSSASFTIPVNTKSTSQIHTTGNARVCNSENEQTTYTLTLNNAKKKLKIRDTERGLSATAYIGRQRDKGFNFFNLLFSISGQAETIDSTGKKHRPHIAFYPDGNNKYIRLSGFRCELRNEMTYDPERKSIYPSKVVITLQDYDATLIVNFDIDGDSIVLQDMYFE